MSFTIENTRVLGADGRIQMGSVSIEGTAIKDAGSGRGGLSGWSVDGCLTLPGIIDLHGDAFERQVMPRPGVSFELDVALLETDRQMIANGITTALHAVTYSWEPGLRGAEMGRAMVAAVERLKTALACDTRLHLRHEAYNLDAVDEIEGWLAEGRIALLAFNDHLEHMKRKLESTEELARYADRSGLTVEEFLALLNKISAREAEVGPAIERLAITAKALGIPCVSHDDETPAMRHWFHALGANICEFPLDVKTARTALELKNEIVMGAPNVVRGGSHTGRLSASEALAQGLCTVLTSDYYYPALLRAPFRLADDGVMSLADAWALVSRNPARAMGFEDRGEIHPGKRADLIVIDDSKPKHPRVIAAFVAGRLVYAANGLAPAMTPAASAA